MTFTTDSKGEIFIEKLRIGEYTVTELKTAPAKGTRSQTPSKSRLLQMKR